MVSETLKDLETRKVKNSHQTVENTGIRHLGSNNRKVRTTHQHSVSWEVRGLENRQAAHVIDPEEGSWRGPEWAPVAA